MGHTGPSMRYRMLSALYPYRICPRVLATPAPWCVGGVNADGRSVLLLLGLLLLLLLLVEAVLEVRLHARRVVHLHVRRAAQVGREARLLLLGLLLLLLLLVEVVLEGAALEVRLHARRVVHHDLRHRELRPH